MIAISKTRFEKFIAFGIGKINTEPSYRTVGNKETPLCSFLINADSKGVGTNREFENYSVNVWGDEAAYASQFEKGDRVFLFGECSKDDYWSDRNGKDEFKINAELLFPINMGVSLLQLQQVFETMDDVPKGTNSAQANIADGFYDYSNLELPKEFQDVSPDI